MYSRSFILALAIVLQTLATSPAHAYIDPGTGSFMVQMLLAAFFGSLFFVKTLWRKMIGFFKRDRSA